VRRADNLATFIHVPIVLKSRSLKLLEPSGPVQACNGITLPLHLPIKLALKWQVEYLHLSFRILIILKHLKVSAKHFITICITPKPLSYFQNALTAHEKRMQFRWYNIIYNTRRLLSFRI